MTETQPLTQTSDDQIFCDGCDELVATADTTTITEGDETLTLCEDCA